MTADKIRPFVLTLRDGPVLTLTRMEHFYELVDRYMGPESATFLRQYVDGRIEEAQDLLDRSDVRSYEAQLESDQRAFQDVEDVCRAMIGEFNRETGRNKLVTLRPWRNQVEKILKIVRGQW